MVPSEIAADAAEEVFRTIEREKMINKSQITEAIERVLVRSQVAIVNPVAVPAWNILSSQGLGNGAWSVGVWGAADASADLNTGIILWDGQK